MSTETLDYRKPLLLIEGKDGFKELDDCIAAPIEEGIPPIKWWIAFICGPLFLLSLGLYGVIRSLTFGTGEWGNNNPAGWAFPIVNFVFWIGIGHAGTLISAVLFLLRQNWRTAIARFAEAMTIFAVITAMVFPILHTGRPWLAHYLLPYPNERNLWVNFTSPLLWDVFAVSTYGAVSIIFWYVGLVPDFAIMRDRTKDGIRKLIYSLFSLGWRGSNRHWQHYEKCYMILAGISTPLVFSVHTIVSFDFATSVIPGWHTTIFPPYFVAGAVFSGFAAVETALIFLRHFFNMKHIVTMNHLDRMNKIIMCTGMMVGYAYAMEFFIAWYGQNPNEAFVFVNRAMGPYAWGYWTMVSCNVIFPQVFWFRQCRRNIPLMFTITIIVNIGMWFERYVIVISSLHRDYLPSSWAYFIPTKIDFCLMLGSFGLFTTLVFLFVRVLPAIAIAEIKMVAPHAQPTHGGH
jgi:molybdopterin-containing oxidoreductase family membrane subunit